MDKNNNIWFDKFNEPKLSNEDWLNPSPDILTSINATIDFEHEERKSNFIWWLLASFFLLSILSLTLYLYSNRENLPDAPTSLVEDEAIATIPLEQTLYIKPTQGDLDKTEVKTNVNEGLPEKMHTGESNKISNKQSTEYKSPLRKHESAIALISNKEILDNSPRYISNSNNKKNVAAPLDVVNHEVRVTDIAPLENSVSALSYKERELDINANPYVDEKSNITAKQSHGLAIFTSLMAMDYKLSADYSSDLNPADFHTDRGNQWGIGVAYTYGLSSKLNFHTTVDYSSLNSISGHKSSINYHVQEEINGLTETHTDLTMATPLGFIETDLLLQRSSDSSGDIISSSANVHSEQVVQALGIGIGLTYDVLQISDYILFVGAGVRSNIILQLSNNLFGLESNSSDYAISSGKVIQSQTNLNNQFLQTNALIGLRRSLSERFDLQFQYEYRNGFSNIYTQDNYSSTINAYGVNLALISKF